MEEKKEATFVVHIKKSTGKGWQGQVNWADRDEKLNFRSALELINIMDSALDYVEVSEAPADGSTKKKGRPSKK
ncbi:MAG: hypothetical protein K5769_10430 [Pseudobutyrivibrio sp.]|nr:hypothetical protein [Pseudobutyrivibrio sp.]